MSSPPDAYRVTRRTPADIKVEFPKRFSRAALLIFVLGLVLSGVFGIPLVNALKAGKATSTYGYGLGVGVMSTVLGIALLVGRRQVLVTGQSVVHRLLIFEFPVLSSEVAKQDVASVEAEDEGSDYYVRIYSKNGPRTHIEGFASAGERDWFHGQLLIALENAEAAFQKNHGTSEPWSP